MNDAGGVGRGDRVGGLGQVLERALQIGAARVDHLPQGFSLDDLHCDEMDRRPAAVRDGLRDLVNGEQVGMVQRRSGARFLDEAGETVGVAGHRFRQHLDGDGSPKFRIVGAIDLAHPAATEQRADPVAAERPAGKIAWR